MASMRPVAPRPGQGAANGGRGIRAAPISTSPTMSPSNADAASTLLRSTRCGASGHITEKAVVSTVSSAFAATNALAYSGWVSASSVATKRVPTLTASAPAARAAAMVRAVPIPPAGTTGGSGQGRRGSDATGGDDGGVGQGAEPGVEQREQPGCAPPVAARLDTLG